MKPTPTLSALMILTLGVSAQAQANWPSFRGAGANGISSGRPTVARWNVETSDNIRWKTEIPGLGHSSPIIWGDRLFVTAAVNPLKPAELKVGLYGDPTSSTDTDSQQWRIFCLNKKTGDILWAKTAYEGAPKQKRHPKATHANCTMATDGTNLVAFFGSEGLYCYDMEGNLRWQKDFGTLRCNPIVYNDEPAPDMSDLEWGFASSPTIYQGRVFVQCDILTNGFVAALQIADGSEIWRTHRDDTGTWSTPNVCDVGGHRELVVNGWKHMGGYDLDTGAEVWRMAGGGDCPVPTPVVWNDLIFLMSAHGPRKPIYAVKLDAAGDVSLAKNVTTNAHVAWSVPRGGSYMETPLIYENRLYTCQVDGVLSCYEAETGNLFYKERLGSGSEGFTASPVASQGKLYFTGEEGTIFVVEPTITFNVLATNQMKEVCMATPAISDGTVYFRTQGHVVAVGGAGN